jgi:hypothetical protein
MEILLKFAYAPLKVQWATPVPPPIDTGSLLVFETSAALEKYQPKVKPAA